jgi:hypothetical protein
MFMKYSRPVVLALMLATMATPAAFAKKGKESAEHKKCVADCRADYKKAAAECKTKKGKDKTQCMTDAKTKKTDCVKGCK